MTITQVKENLSAMLHGGTLNKVRNLEALFERAANTLLSKIDPVDTERIAALTSTIHDDIYNYALPDDYKEIIDLYPQDRRNAHDTANKVYAEKFSLTKGLNYKRLTIEGSEGSKVININWRSRAPKTINELNTLTANGTWSAVGTATGLSADDIDYVSGSGSLKFDLGATGDGMQNTTMTAIDLTDEDETADFFLWFKIKNSADLALLTSVSLIWGNDLSANYWTGVAQTAQADGTALKVGWNLIKIPWSTATETGTVDPATIDSAKITFATTGAILDIRIDNITCSIGRNFDIKYYSKYIIKNSSGIWIPRFTTDDDIVVLDEDAINIYYLELLKASAHQVEGADSLFDLNYGDKELDTLYRKYKLRYSSEAKKKIGFSGGLPARGRW